MQDLVADLGERDGDLEVVGRLVRADEPAADRERDFLLGRQLRVVGEPLERGQPADRVFVHFGGDFLGETLGQPRPFSSAIFATCSLSSSSTSCGGRLRPRTCPAARGPAQRFAGDAFGGKLREQIAGELVLAGFGAQLNFLEDQSRAELAQLLDVLLQDPCVRESP